MTALTAIAAPTRRRRQRLGPWLYYTVAFLALVFFVLPLLWAVLTSFEPSSTLGAGFSVSRYVHLTFQNYSSIFSGSGGIAHSLLNSVVVALLTGLITVVVTTLGGYAFARLPFPGRGLLFVALLSALMVPYQSLLEPLFLVLKDLHLQGQLVGLAAIYITFQIPFGLFVMRTTFQAIPIVLEEAAAIDGASFGMVMWRILRPLVLPGMATVLIFSFLFAWNDFLLSLTILTDNTRFTLPVSLENIVQGQYGTVNYGNLEAGAVLSMLPCIILFLALQRHYVRGLIAGAVR